MTANKRDKKGRFAPVHTLTITKGCKKGIDYVNILYDGTPFVSLYGLAKILTGVTEMYPSCAGLFAEDVSLEGIRIIYGDQSASLAEIMSTARDQLPEHSKIFMLTLSKQQPIDLYAKIIQVRIQAVRAWVEEQDFDQTITIEV
jgi:hypothetical protein